MLIKKVEVRIINEYEKSFSGLTDNILRDKVSESIEFLKKDKNLGNKIQKNLWPKRYRKIYHIDNLWRYNVGSHRLIYTIITEYDTKTYALLDVLSHPKYEELFNYRNG